MRDPDVLDMRLLEKSARVVEKKWELSEPDYTLVLGSGWGEVVDLFNIRSSISYQDIPALRGEAVEGHTGRLSWGEIYDKSVLIFEGRKHYYEKLGWTPIAAPVYIAKALESKSLILTNAAGGIAEDFRPGTLMIISDHINFMGDSPLRGEHHEFWGPRFPDMTYVYDRELRGQLSLAAAKANVTIHEGVYCGWMGPCYETPAEILMMKKLGGDAVGMSTVPEATLARAAGLRVCGVSCITNFAAGLSGAELSHDEVTEVVSGAVGRIASLLRELFKGA